MAAALLTLAVMAVVAVHYILEVHSGSSMSVHDCEIGISPHESTESRLPKSEFFGRLAPLVLASMGFPLLFQSVRIGAVLLVLSLVSFVCHAGETPRHKEVSS